jgi:hypothetical protein
MTACVCVYGLGGDRIVWILCVMILCVMHTKFQIHSPLCTQKRIRSILLSDHIVKERKIRVCFDIDKVG